MVSARPIVLFFALLAVSATPARAIELPKSFACPALLDEPAWRDYQSCFEHVDGDVLLCAILLLKRLPPEKQALGRAALIDRIAALLDESRIPHRRHPERPYDLILDPAMLENRFPTIARRLASALNGKRPAISDFVVSLDNAESGMVAYYHQKGRRLALTPGGLASVLKGEDEAFLTVEHELGHAFLSVSDSHLNTTIGTMVSVPGKEGAVPWMPAMPTGYQAFVSVQEAHTYSRELASLLRSFAKAVRKGRLGRSLFAEALALFGSAPRYEIPQLKRFISGYREEIASLARFLDEGTASVAYDDAAKSLVLYTPEGRFFAFGSLSLSAAEIESLRIWSALMAIQTPTGIAKNDLRVFSGTSSAAARSVESLGRKVRTRLCVLVAMLDERASAIADLESASIARSAGLRRGESLSEAEMETFLVAMATRLSRGLKPSVLAGYARACVGK